MKGRRSTPGRYFQVAEPGTGWGGTQISDPLTVLGPFNPKVAKPGTRMLMVSTTGEHFAYFELDESLNPVEKPLPDNLRQSVERIQENCEPALCTVLFMGGAGGSLRAGVTDNPVRLTRSVKDALTSVTSGGAPVYVWPGGGITFMVDVTQMPPPAPSATCRRPLWSRRSSSRCGYQTTPRSAATWTTCGRCPRSIATPRCATRRLRRKRIGRHDAPSADRAAPDGRRLHLNDGPIDLVIEASGGRAEVEIAYAAAAESLTGLLDKLCDELPQLRRRAAAGIPSLKGVVARRMHAAVAPYADMHFITPMAAVAGAVAEEVLGAMTRAAKLDRAYVNNGGDIALHLAPSHSFTVGLVSHVDPPTLAGKTVIDADSAVRGIATSGRHGRSFSLGIADAVTVLARTASQADAAATMIANAVDLPGHPGIARVPACDIQPDSDLGTRSSPAALRD